MRKIKILNNLLRKHFQIGMEERVVYLDLGQKSILKIVKRFNCQNYKKVVNIFKYNKQD